MANNDWWAKKLGNPNPQPSIPPTGPIAPRTYTPPTQQPNIQVGYDPEKDTLVAKAPSSRLNDVCPNCTSGNYFAPPGTQRQRCYDCGYPVVQSGSGAGTPGQSSGPTQKAKQVGSSGFNPNVIVDRIG